MRSKDRNVFSVFLRICAIRVKTLTVPPAPGLYMTRPSVSVVLSLKETLPAIVDSHEGRTWKHFNNVSKGRRAVML